MGIFSEPGFNVFIGLPDALAIWLINICGGDHKAVVELFSGTLKARRVISCAVGFSYAEDPDSKRIFLMKGTVVHHEHRIGYIIIRDEKDEFAIAELLGNYDVERGDIVSGNLHTNGNETLHNQTQDEAMAVVVKGYGLSEQDAIGLILRTH